MTKPHIIIHNINTVQNTAADTHLHHCKTHLFCHSYGNEYSLFIDYCTGNHNGESHYYKEHILHCWSVITHVSWTASLLLITMNKRLSVSSCVFDHPQKMKTDSYQIKSAILDAQRTEQRTFLYMQRKHLRSWFDLWDTWKQYICCDISPWLGLM